MRRPRGNLTVASETLRDHRVGRPEAVAGVAVGPAGAGVRAERDVAPVPFFNGKVCWIRSFNFARGKSDKLEGRPSFP